MSEGLAYIDIVFFAAVAGVILYRLYTVLGRRTGLEKRRPTRFDTAPAEKPAPAPVEPTPAEPAPASTTPRDPAVETGLAEIRLADPAFDLAHFLEGARKAFELILEAFAKGDKETLAFLCAPEVYERFVEVIEERARQGWQAEVQVVAIRRSEVVEAGMRGHEARITVHFVSEQIACTRDAEGRVVEGHPTRVEEVEDLWTFARDVRADDPNWKLVETRVPG